MGKLVLITGGVRSGKSRRALELAGGRTGAKLFVATALPSDAEMVARISRHRSERDRSWRTEEALSGRLADRLTGATEETLLLDCLGLYVSRRMMEGAPAGEVAAESAEAAEAAAAAFEYSVFVTNEVGWGLVPDNALGRSFVEALGAANRAVAEAAAEVLMMVAGIELRLR